MKGHSREVIGPDDVGRLQSLASKGFTFRVEGVLTSLAELAQQVAPKTWTKRTIRAALGAVDALMSTDFDNGNAKWPDGVATSDMMEAQAYLQVLLQRAYRAWGRAADLACDLDATPKVLRIQSTSEEAGASWIERYFLKDRAGRYRELKNIPGNGQYAPGTAEILTWFKKLGVTHVEVMEGWHETVPAKTYTLKVFARHMRRISEKE